MGLELGVNYIGKLERKDCIVIHMMAMLCIKILRLGYKKNRMNLSYSDRCQLAGEELKIYLVPIYGEDFNDRFNNEYITDDMWTLEKAYKG